MNRQFKGSSGQDNGSLSIQPLLSGLLGIILLLPAGFFLLALVTRMVTGSKSLYYSMSPSFLQSPFYLLAWHKAQFILCSLLLAILFNVLTVFPCRLEKGDKGWEVVLFYRRFWLNTAIVLQGALMLLVLGIYMLIQHIRYFSLTIDLQVNSF